MLLGNFARAATSCCFASASRSRAILASASLAIVSGRGRVDLERRVEARERLGGPALVQEETALAVERVDVARVELHGLREGVARVARRAALEADPRPGGVRARELAGDAFARAGPSSTMARSASGCAASTVALFRRARSVSAPGCSGDAASVASISFLRIRRVAEEVVGAREAEVRARVAREREPPA